MTKYYTVSKGTNDGNLAFAWQLSCNRKHVQWFSDESIARKSCDELNSIELINEITKAETVTEFADRCQECGKTIKQRYTDEFLDKIKTEIEKLTSRYTISRERGGMGQVEWSDRLIKESEVLQILDKYKAEREGKQN